MALSTLLRVGRWLAVVLLLVVGLYAAFSWWRGGVRMTEENVEKAIVATLQREAPASFYVTGTLDLTATTTVENTKVFMPRFFNLDVGTSAATVRLPGRALYGFDIRALGENDIRLHKDGRVQVRVPELSVYAVDAALSEMEVKTSTGWTRVFGNSDQQVRDEALRMAEEALRRQAQLHLEDSDQPDIHTARALEKLLRPVLQAAGIEDPRISVQVSPELHFENGG